MGVGTGDEGESQEEEEDDEEQADFGSQVILNSSTQENEACTDRYHGPIWCSEDNKQNHKHIRPVKKLCEYDEFGNANWGE